MQDEKNSDKIRSHMNSANVKAFRVLIKNIKKTIEREIK